MDQKLAIGIEIKKIRKTLGMTQEEYCEYYNKMEPRELQIDRSGLSHYELGHSTPPATKYRKMLLLSPRHRPLMKAIDFNLV